MNGLRTKEGTQRWDIPFVIIIAMVGPLAVYVVAGLDRRFGWSAPVHPGVSIAAGAVLIAALLIVERAMHANSFFSSVVRLQHDRGQTVVSSGPYARVRHPGYVGGIIQGACIPPLLGSWWAFLPAGLVVVAFVIRTALEDALLRKSLPGYSAYAERVRWRLLPGLW